MPLVFAALGGNTVSPCLVNLSSASMRCLETVRVLGLPFFEALMVTLHLSTSTSVHSNRSASLYLHPVSHNKWLNAMLSLWPQLTASCSSWSVGMKTGLSSRLYLGFSHVLPINLTNESYAHVANRFVFLSAKRVAMASLIDSGSKMSTSALLKR